MQSRACRHSMFVVLLSVAFFAASPVAAHAQKYWIQGRDSTTHYGARSQIWVNSPKPGTNFNKVTVIWGYTTNEANFVEAGHTLDGAYGGSYWAFWATMRNGVYGGIHPIQSNLPLGSYQDYALGWNQATNRHLVWMNAGTKTSTIYIPEMTSQWPGTSCEKDDISTANNYGYFRYLTYKAKTTLWTNWGNAQQYYDNDPYYYFRRLSPNSLETPHV